MIKAPVQRLNSGLRLIFGWKYVRPSGSYLIGQGCTLRAALKCPTMAAQSGVPPGM